MELDLYAPYMVSRLGQGRIYTFRSLIYSYFVSDVPDRWSIVEHTNVQVMNRNTQPYPSAPPGPSLARGRETGKSKCVQSVKKAC